MLHKCTGEPPEASGKEHPTLVGSSISTKKKKGTSYTSPGELDTKQTNETLMKPADFHKQHHQTIKSHPTLNTAHAANGGSAPAALSTPAALSSGGMGSLLCWKNPVVDQIPNLLSSEMLPTHVASRDCSRVRSSSWA